MKKLKSELEKACIGQLEVGCIEKSVDRRMRQKMAKSMSPKYGINIRRWSEIWVPLHW